MSNSNELVYKNFIYNDKHMYELKDHSYTKMIIESYDKLSKSQAMKFLQQAVSAESKLSLLDAMKDKVTLNSEEIGELVPSIDSSSSLAITDVSSFENLSHLSLFIPQQRSPHILTSFNNAAQPTRTSSNGNKRSSLLLRGLFGHSSKKRAATVKQTLHTNKKRTISGGDQVKLSSTRLSHTEQPYRRKYHYDTNENLTTTNNTCQLSFQGLRYDFKKIKSLSTIKNSSVPLPSVNHPSLVPDKSLPSLNEPTSILHPIKEQKQRIQSAYNISGIPKLKTSNTLPEKISFHADQHKYHTQTPNYHYPRRLSAIEILTKQYSSSITPRNSTGLVWYNNPQPSPMNRTITYSKGNNKFDSSSDSRDTSSSSSTNSSTSSSSSSSSSSSNTQKPSKSSSSSSSSTSSNSSSQQQKIKTTRQYNRNQNDKDDVIQLDLNSNTSQTSTSSSNTSIQHCYQRSISRRQKSSSSSTNIPPVVDLFSSINNRTTGKFKVKRQRIERNIII